MLYLKVSLQSSFSYYISAACMTKQSLIFNIENMKNIHYSLTNQIGYISTCYNNAKY